MLRNESVEDFYGRGRPLHVTRRIARTKGKRQFGPSIRVKCSCCSEEIVIYHGEDVGTPQGRLGSLEIGGVHASIDQWRKVLLPLLSVKMPHDQFDNLPAPGLMPDVTH